MSEAVRPTVDDVLRVLQLQQDGDGRYVGQCLATEGPVVPGAQMIAQAIVAATAEAGGKRVTSISSNFARTGRADTPVTLEVERFHEGRSLASVTVTVSQGDRKLARSLVLLGADEADVIRHGSEPPAIGGPDAAVAQDSHLEGHEQRIVDGVDVFDPALVGPPELRYWSRWATDRTERDVSQALLTWASTNSFLGAAMRPHEGVGLSLAHRSLSTGVLSHTLYFHDDVAAGEWLLYSLRSTFTGGGRAFGVGEVFTEDGRLVATATQESMIRPMTGGAL
ncbi:acyl-CoA thioesterase II [Blastococcus sp. TF02A-26]|uniref:acyl-CoA thioesterase n=1 Tax=Blastococcus sp. TF02A-26 TaxID=2250577 RepID=UPI000DEA1DE1|nr:acyl-CoA thioesterase domain-containing protein [Blastococcus sp. TF02A-26]RBY90756.1 acyl-CoA thioesterase II [Blastococcus sp. TF02A-26]